MAGRRLRAAAIGSAVVGVLVAATTASAETLTYGPNSALQPFHRWTVPAGVCAATFDLSGAEGSGGVFGARVTSTLTVTPGTAYDIYVGGAGVRGSGGYNGGGDASGTGGVEGVGGGGATDVRTGTGLTDRILVAGGGGGNGGSLTDTIGGAGGAGGLVGQNGTFTSGLPFVGLGGGGGTATAGGPAGMSGLNPAFDGTAGTLGVGGNGGFVSGSTNVGYGGGGGGGLFGGGGGGAGQADGGGGGGGSSLAAGGTVSAASTAAGRAVITFTPSPACSQAAGPGGGTGANPGAAIVVGTGRDADRTGPTLGGLTFARTSFATTRSGTSGRARRRTVGTAVSFSLSEASRVTFSVERPVAGRRVNGSCVRPTRSNRRQRRCTRWATVGSSFGVPGKVGQNTFTFQGRVAGKALKPGRYRLVGQATDPAGNTSSLQRKNFEIVR